MAMGTVDQARSLMFDNAPTGKTQAGIDAYDPSNGVNPLLVSLFTLLL